MRNSIGSTVERRLYLPAASYELPSAVPETSYSIIWFMFPPTDQLPKSFSKVYLTSKSTPAVSTSSPLINSAIIIVISCGTFTAGS